MIGDPISMAFLMAVDILRSTTVEKLPSDLEGMETSMERLLVLIDDVCKYVDDVVVRCSGCALTLLQHCFLVSCLLIVFSDSRYMIFFYQEGRVAPNDNIGRFISDTVASIPKLSPPAFDKLMSDSLQVNVNLSFFADREC